MKLQTMVTGGGKGQSENGGGGLGMIRMILGAEGLRRLQ